MAWGAETLGDGACCGVAYGEALAVCWLAAGEAVWRFWTNCWWAGDARACAKGALE
jgi:hypothetical protein